MDLVQGALQAEAVQSAQGPGGLGPRPTVGQADMLGDVEAIAVVSLDPLDAEGAARAGPDRATTPPPPDW